MSRRHSPMIKAKLDNPTATVKPFKRGSKEIIDPAAAMSHNRTNEIVDGVNLIFRRSDCEVGVGIFRAT